MFALLWMLIIAFRTLKFRDKFGKKIVYLGQIETFSAKNPTHMKIYKVCICVILSIG